MACYNPPAMDYRSAFFTIALLALTPLVFPAASLAQDEATDEATVEEPPRLPFPSMAPT